ncbi:MAG: hypothetical protein FWD94_04110 [Treponema sp.]|nr:hypothetical protein [Treponema sp.]
MIPSKENSTVSIPDEFYGMQVEVLVFPIPTAKTNQNGGTLDDIFDGHLYSFDNFKFDRDEANNYD